MKWKFQLTAFVAVILLTIILESYHVDAEDSGSSGGVGATQNKGAATSREKNICELFPRPGPCMSVIILWHYDCDSNECKTFSYGGCEGNPNQFRNKEDCEKACKKDAPYCKTDKPPKRNDWFHPIRVNKTGLKL